MGVLFENSIVCHVFYAMALGLRMLFVWFWGLFCFGLPGPHLCGGWVGPWSGFLGCCTDLWGSWLVGWGSLFVGFVWRV